MAGLAGCRECHTRPGAAAFSGGEPLETRFGTFVGPNITPDPEHGIGGWSYDDFAGAVREGHGPTERYWPVFPYGWFSGLSDGDLASLWAHLVTVPADPTPSAEQDPSVPGIGKGLWRTFVFRRHQWDDVQDRGEYLVEVVGHCSGCHTPRTWIGAERPRRHLAGNEQPPHGGPNLTPSEDGTAGWSEADWVSFFELGLTPEGEFVGGGMKHVIADGTAKLSDADRRAMARYLMSLPPRPTR